MTRRIEIRHWKEKKVNTQEEVEAGTIGLITNMIAAIPPQKLPRGVKNFLVVNRLQKSLAAAEDKKELVLEEDVYKFLMDHCMAEIASRWGMMPDVSKAILDIINAEEENPNE